MYYLNIDVAILWCPATPLVEMSTDKPRTVRCGGYLKSGGLVWPQQRPPRSHGTVHLSQVALSVRTYMCRSDCIT